MLFLLNSLAFSSDKTKSKTDITEAASTSSSSLGTVKRLCSKSYDTLYALSSAMSGRTESMGRLRQQQQQPQQPHQHHQVLLQQPPRPGNGGSAALGQVGTGSSPNLWKCGTPAPSTSCSNTPTSSHHTTLLANSVHGCCAESVDGHGVDETASGRHSPGLKRRLSSIRRRFGGGGGGSSTATSANNNSNTNNNSSSSAKTPATPPRMPLETMRFPLAVFDVSTAQFPVNDGQPLSQPPDADALF